MDARVDKGISSSAPRTPTAGGQPTLETGFLARREAADDAFPTGLVAVGAAGGLGGLALRGAGHRALGTGVAGVGAALLGAALLAGCSDDGAATTAADRFAARDIALDLGSSTELPRAVDRTAPAPAGYRGGSPVRQAREGVVQVAHAQGTGSGWVVAPGLVVTNHHVVSGVATPISVVDGAGGRHAARLVARDRANDLALLRVDDLADRPLPMDDSVELLEEADTTGYPDGVFRNDRARAWADVDVTEGRLRQASILFAGSSAAGVSGGAIINGSGEVLATAYAVGAMPVDAAGMRQAIVVGVPNAPVRALVHSVGATPG